jgi:predicted RNA binding protein YcfA (HicA-like mRNA interferase family)
VRYREVVRRLTALGCREVHRTGDGSHRKWLNPATGQIAILPDWGGDDLKLGTIRAALRQLGIGWDDFMRA